MSLFIFILMRVSKQQIELRNKISLTNFFYTQTQTPFAVVSNEDSSSLELSLELRLES